MLLPGPTLNRTVTQQQKKNPSVTIFEYLEVLNLERQLFDMNQKVIIEVYIRLASV